MKLLPPALALLLLAPPAGAAELGRLFFTPDQRTSLDTARSKRTRTAVGTEDTAVAPAAPAPEVVTYGGVVRRSDGKSTVWLNNRALSGKEAAQAPLLRRVRPDGSVTLQGKDGGRDVDLKVGQRAELLTGTVQEGYLSGPAAKPAAKPEPALAGKPDAVPAAKPLADAGATVAEADRRQEEREQRQQLEDAIRAMKEAAAAAKSAGTAPQPGIVPAPPAK